MSLASTAALLLRRINGVVMVPCMAALLLAAGLLTYSVVVRYAYRAPTDWQDEIAVFLLVGAMFLSGAQVQSQRGHIGIEAIAGLLPPAIERLRRSFVDLVTVAFCGFFAWKSWTLFGVAWSEGQTSTSTLAPPLWIPYSTMSLGMTLLALQALLQLLDRAGPEPR